MMKIIFIKTLILLGMIYMITYTTSCVTNEKQAKRRVAKLISKYSGIIDTTTKIDTQIVHDTFVLKVTPVITQNHVDSILNIYCDLRISDTSKTPDSTIVYKEKIIRETIYRECQNINNGTYKVRDQYNDTLDITINGKNISIFRNDKKIIITRTIKVPCPSCDLTWWQETKKYGFTWIIIFVCGFFSFPLLKTILKIWIKIWIKI